MAKAWCADASHRVMAAGIAGHGGIGSRWEHTSIVTERGPDRRASFGNAPGTGAQNRLLPGTAPGRRGGADLSRGRERRPLFPAERRSRAGLRTASVSCWISMGGRAG